ncbi:hypothetical protein BH09ACT1_BH09ACT1_22890 [soil metagenome]
MIALVVLYVIVDVVLQFLPPHYSVLTDAESDLAVGPYGAVMRANFLARGVMSGCLVALVLLRWRITRARVIGAGLVAFAGVCSAALVFFATDVNRPGEYGMSPRTLVGTTHVVFATSGFLAVLAGMIVLTVALRGVLPARSRRWVIASLGVAVIGLLLLAVSLLLVPQIVGVTERLCLAGILGWAFAVAAATLPATAKATRPETP